MAGARKGVSTVYVPPECRRSRGAASRLARGSQILLLRTTKVSDAGPVVGAVSFQELFRRADVRQNVVLRPNDILYVPPDYIARSNRVLQHISNIVSPFAQVFGIISQVVILSRVGVGGSN
jgi:hypothetical protein